MEWNSLSSLFPLCLSLVPPFHSSLFSFFSMMKCSSSISCLVWKRVLYFPFASVGTTSSSRRRRRRRFNNKHKAVSFVRSIRTDWLFHSLSHVVFLFFIAFQLKSMFDFLPICEFARLWQSNCLLIFIKSWSEFHQHISILMMKN